MFDFDDAKVLDIARAGERYAIKWQPVKKGFMFSKAKFQEPNLANSSIDIVYTQGEAFIAVRSGDEGACMKSRSGTQKSRNLTPSTYSDNLHEYLVETKEWSAGSELDLEYTATPTTGLLEGCAIYLVVNKDLLVPSELPKKEETLKGAVDEATDNPPMAEDKPEISEETF